MFRKTPDRPYHGNSQEDIVSYYRSHIKSFRRSLSASKRKIGNSIRNDLARASELGGVYMPRLENATSNFDKGLLLVKYIQNLFNKDHENDNHIEFNQYCEWLIDKAIETQFNKRPYVVFPKAQVQSCLAIVKEAVRRYREDNFLDRDEPVNYDFHNNVHHVAKWAKEKKFETQEGLLCIPGEIINIDYELLSDARIALQAYIGLGPGLEKVEIFVFSERRQFDKIEYPCYRQGWVGQESRFVLDWRNYGFDRPAKSEHYGVDFRTK